MSERMDTVSLALPKWVNEYYEEAHWEVRMKKSALMREVLLGYARAKIAEVQEEQRPSPGRSKAQTPRRADR